MCLETQNKLLNLLAYYGVGNPFVERRSLALAKKPPELQSAFAEVGDSAPDEMASLPSAELQNSDGEFQNNSIAISSIFKLSYTVIVTPLGGGEALNLYKQVTSTAANHKNFFFFFLFFLSS